MTRPKFVQATHCVVKQGVPRLITHLQHLLTRDMVQELGDQVEVVGSFKSTGFLLSVYFQFHSRGSNAKKQ